MVSDTSGLGVERLVRELRAAIERRADQRPGTASHWRAVCEVKRLQRLLVQPEPASVARVRDAA
jgi:hypothetical protein